MTAVAYLRVSSNDQNLARQEELLKKYPIEKVFQEKASAKDTKRPQLQALIDWMREGDTVYVASIDRLGRSLSDLNDLTTLFRSKGVTIHFDKEGLTFSGSKSPSASENFVFHTFATAAQFERELIKERQREGIKVAKKKGKYGNRPKALTPEQEEEVLDLYFKQTDSYHMNKTAIARKMGVSRTVIFRIIADEEKRRAKANKETA